MTTKALLPLATAALLACHGGCAVEPDDDCDRMRLDEHSLPPLDILFVVDNSGSMGEEQEVLADQVGVAIREIIAPADPAAPRFDDVHVGIVSTDMGAGGYEIQGCEDPAGDDGVLRNRGLSEGCLELYTATDCDRDECPWLSHSEEGRDDGADDGNPPIWEDFWCIAPLGTSGCELEQPLEASRVALIEQTAPGMPNEGFLRDESNLVIVYVTDGDDCSAANPDLYDPEAQEYGGLDVRCALNPEELHPVSRYRDAFAALRPGREDLVSIVVIGGIPLDGSWQPGDPVDVLGELQRVDPDDPESLVATCETSRGAAVPPVRLVELAYAFPSYSFLISVCRDDWSSVFYPIISPISVPTPSICLDGRFTSVGSESCRVIETRVDDAECPELADAPSSARSEGCRVDLGVVEVDGVSRRQCEILPADYDGDGCPDGADCEGEDAEGGLEGWFFDPQCLDHGMIRFKVDLEFESEVQLECCDR